MGFVFDNVEVVGEVWFWVMVMIVFFFSDFIVYVYVNEGWLM